MKEGGREGGSECWGFYVYVFVEREGEGGERKGGREGGRERNSGGEECACSVLLHNSTELLRYPVLRSEGWLRSTQAYC